MAGVAIDYHVDDSDAQAGFARLERAMDNTDPVMRAIGTGLVKGTQRRFREQKGPDGASWTALNPDYAAGKRNTRILTESGRLSKSVTADPGRSEVRVGTNLIYAAIHQFGGTIKPVKGDRLIFSIGGRTVGARSVTIPARPYLGVDADDRAMITRVIERFLNRALP